VSAVTLGQAALCAEFLIDQEDAGEDYAAPLDLLDAVTCYRSDKSEWSRGKVLAAIVGWLRLDPRACIALLGPGLGIDQAWPEVSR
jgi:hypothetical protein